MKKFTFSNKNNNINATIDNGVVTYEDGNSYTITARYGAEGISGAYITVDGVTYSLKAAEFKQVADELVPYIQAQPKKERKADRGAVKAKNLVKLASASDNRIAALLCDGFFAKCETCKQYGASIEQIERAQAIAVQALTDGDAYAELCKAVEAELAVEREREAAERAERERKAREAAQDKIIVGIMGAYGVNRATAEAMAQALASVNIELPQA